MERKKYRKVLKLNQVFRLKSKKKIKFKKKNGKRSKSLAGSTNYNSKQFYSKSKSRTIWLKTHLKKMKEQ